MKLLLALYHMSGKFYVTTSIAYTNADPHLGFALEAVQADVLARHNRLAGKEVLFLTGTDEHGAKIAKSAEKAGREPEEFVGEISSRFKKLKEVLNLSNDDFIRTSDRVRHWPAVAKVWLKLQKNGDIYKKKYKGLYCPGCEAFITKKDLRDGKCSVHCAAPEIVEEENYFFRLSRYSKKIERMIAKNKIRVVPQSRKNEILSFVGQGLEDISFSRPRKDLKWAIPVPKDPAASVYVWADALTNYISALGYAQDGPKFKKFWPADVHCIGKDILKFHGAIWPGMLLSLHLPLPRIILVHGFIGVGGRKMSKTLGNVIDPFGLAEKYGTDPVRYYLLREISPTEDGDFTYAKFERRYNADLASGLGNLTARVTTMAAGLEFPEKRIRVNPGLKDQMKKARKGCGERLKDFKFNEALASVWELIGFCDRYIEKERPWEGSKKQAVYGLLVALTEVASLIRPFMPETSEKIFSQLGIKNGKFSIKKGEPLFPRI